MTNSESTADAEDFRPERLEALAARLSGASLSPTTRAEVDLHIAELERLCSDAGPGIRERRDPRAPSPGQRFIPPYVVDSRTGDSVDGHCTFGPFFLGSDDESEQLGSVHGGALALMFDDALGYVAVRGGTVRTRTAYLHINYRSTARVGSELRFRGWVDRVEGRKQFIAGQLKDGETVVADVESLFVTPKAWQE
jgi:hypothetical protein